MAVREAGSSPVVIFGGPSEVSGSLVAAFRRDGVEASDGRDVHTVASMIVVLDQHGAESLFKERHSYASRKRLKAWEDDVCESAVATALSTGARRLLAVCDARQLSFGQRLRALSRIQGVAQRVGYECAINGLDGLATSYALIGTDNDLHRIVDAAVAWHQGVIPSHVRDVRRTPESAAAPIDAVLRR